MIIEVVLGLFFLLFLWRSLKKPSNYPPGLWGLPYLGYIPLSKKSLFQQLLDLRSKLGNVVIWRIGTKVCLFVYDFKLIKECMNRDDFSDRPNVVVIRFLDKRNLGLIGSNDQLWINNRRFTLRQLRDLGMGKSRMALAVQQEAEFLMEEMKKHAGTPVKIPHALPVAVLNVVWQMVSGKKYDLDDPKIAKLENMIDEVQKSFGRIAIVDFFPWLKNIVPAFLFAKIIQKDIIDNARAAFRNFFQDVIDEYESNPEASEGSFISAYFEEMKKQGADPTSTMSKDDLKQSLVDLFGAGSETTATTLIWTIFYLANHQDVQKILQQEVDRVLPKGTLASLEDKPRLPYTESVIHEIHRHVSFINIGVMHSTKNETTLAGYTIPKGAIVMPVFGHVHYDLKYWKNPEEFRPERHLDREGKFVHPKEGFIPFGIGKRQCVGESLARLELLIFLTALVQNFSFCPPPGKQMDLTELPTNPFGRLPKEDQDIIFNIR